MVSSFFGKSVREKGMAHDQEAPEQGCLQFDYVLRTVARSFSKPAQRG